MNKLFIRTCTLILSQVMISCFIGNYPISNSDESVIKENLLGSWVLLSQTDSCNFPLVEINVMAFNNQEYVVSATRLGKQGRTIEGAEIFRVFNAVIDSNTFLNIQSLRESQKKYTYFHLCNRGESITNLQGRFLKDTLNINFENELELETFLTKALQEDQNYFTDSITLYRWSSLNSSILENPFLKDEILYAEEYRDLEEEAFLSLGIEDMNNLSDKSLVDIWTGRFNEIHLTDYGRKTWKVPYFVMIYWKSGKTTKLKVDRGMNNIYDYNSDYYYKIPK